jgi:acetyl-CoA acetyltransferase
MVFPENAAKPATTSEMSALSQVTVIRGCCSAWAAVTTGAGGVTSGSAAVGRICSAGGFSSEAQVLDQARKLWSAPKLIRTASPSRSTR